MALSQAEIALLQDPKFQARFPRFAQQFALVAQKLRDHGPGCSQLIWLWDQVKGSVTTIAPTLPRPPIPAVKAPSTNRPLSPYATPAERAAVQILSSFRKP